MIIPLLEPNQRKPGTRIHKGASRPCGVIPPAAGHRLSIRARDLSWAPAIQKASEDPQMIEDALACTTRFVVVTWIISGWLDSCWILEAGFLGVWILEAG